MTLNKVQLRQHDLTMLLLKQQDTSKLSPEQLVDLYHEIFAKVYAKDSKDYVMKKR